MRLLEKFRHTTLFDKVVSRFWTSVGLFLGLNMIPSLALASGVGEEKYGLTGKNEKPFAGVVVHIQKKSASGLSKLLVDKVVVLPSGRPDCQKATGHLIEVLTGNTRWPHRSSGSLVVTGDLMSTNSPSLAVGDCLSVRGKVINRLTGPSDEDRIRIVPAFERSNRNIRMIQADMFRVWTEHPSREARRKHPSPKSSSPHPHSPLPQKA